METLNPWRDGVSPSGTRTTEASLPLPAETSDGNSNAAPDFYHGASTSIDASDEAADQDTSSIWATVPHDSTAQSNNATQAVIADLDPFSSIAAVPFATSSQPTPVARESSRDDALDPKASSAAMKPETQTKSSLSAPSMAPALSFSSIANAFRRAPSTAATPAVSRPETPKQQHQIDRQPSEAYSEKAGQAADEEPDVPFDFAKFLEQLRTKPADPIAKYLRR